VGKLTKKEAPGGIQIRNPWVWSLWSH